MVCVRREQLSRRVGHVERAEHRVRRGASNRNIDAAPVLIGGVGRLPAACRRRHPRGKRGHYARSADGRVQQSGYQERAVANGLGFKPLRSKTPQQPIQRIGFRRLRDRPSFGDRRWRSPSAGAFASGSSRFGRIRCSANRVAPDASDAAPCVRSRQVWRRSRHRSDDARGD